MKKILATLLALALAASLASCGTHPAVAVETVAYESLDAVAEAEAGGYNLDNIRENTWALGTDSVEDTVTHLFAARFSNLVEQYSGGKMHINVYSNAKIGNDQSLIESVKAYDGGASFVVQTTAPQVSVMPKLAVFDIPCAYQTIEEFREAVDQPEFMELLEQVYTEADLKLLGLADQGFRVMTSNKMIDSMDDFQGIKIRTMSNSNHMAFWDAIGANPTPLAWSETFTSLQTKAIDAQENPYELIAGSKLYEVQDYAVNTNHVAHTLALVTSDALWQELNEDERAVLARAAEEARTYAREQADVRAGERIQMCIDGGMEVVDLSDELWAELVEASQPVYASLREVTGDDLYNAYLANQ